MKNVLERTNIESTKTPRCVYRFGHFVFFSYNIFFVYTLILNETNKLTDTNLNAEKMQKKTTVSGDVSDSERERK